LSKGEESIAEKIVDAAFTVHKDLLAYVPKAKEPAINSSERLFEISPF